MHALGSEGRRRQICKQKEKKETETKTIFASEFHLIDKFSYTSVLHDSEYVWSKKIFTPLHFESILWARFPTIRCKVNESEIGLQHIVRRASDTDTR